ncbi:ataxin-2 homolog [Procambarus clarkii]|uniref:ataxin-2 homolog n=1 Tax=Procambarus clarkii TaxID=6728 RepID=UPI003743C1F6
MRPDRLITIVLLVLLHGPEGDTAAATAGLHDERGPKRDTVAAAAGLQDEEGPEGDTAAATAGLQDERGPKGSTVAAAAGLQDEEGSKRDTVAAAAGLQDEEGPEGDTAAAAAGLQDERGPKGSTVAAAAGLQDEEGSKRDTVAAAADLQDEQGPKGGTVAAAAGLQDEQKGGLSFSSGTSLHLDDGHNDQQDGTTVASNTLAHSLDNQRTPTWSAPFPHTSQSQVTVQPIHIWNNNLYVSQIPLPYASFLLPHASTSLFFTTSNLPHASLQPQTIPTTSSSLLNVDGMQRKLILIPDSFRSPFFHEQRPLQDNSQGNQPLVGLVPQRLQSSGESKVAKSSFSITKEALSGAMKNKLQKAPHEVSLMELQDVPQEAQESQQEALQESQQEALQESQQEALQESQQEALQESQEALQESQQEALQESQEALQESQQKALQESHQEALQESHQEALQESQQEALQESQQKAPDTQQEALEVLQETQEEVSLLPAILESFEPIDNPGLLKTILFPGRPTEPARFSSSTSGLEAIIFPSAIPPAAEKAPTTPYLFIYLFIYLCIYKNVHKECEDTIMVITVL